jgi:uncharacterized repeat protein (TIGR03803 family)
MKIKLTSIGLFCAAALGLPAFGVCAQTGAVLTTLHSFQSFPNGDNPKASLVQGSDGYLYGTTEWGGTNGFGTVFKISTNGTMTTLYSFGDGNDGGNPTAGLFQGKDGYFYGTTYGNLYTYGPSFGTVFKVSTNGALSTLYSFSGGNDGGNPSAGLVQGSDGNFYGTTEYGGQTNYNYYDNFDGVDGYGTVFKISTNGALTTLYAFGTVTDYDGDPLDGANPYAALVQGSDGYFYGTTSDLSGFGAGTVFKISTNGALTTLYSFTGGNDGAQHYAGLVQGSDGSYYGTTSSGGEGRAGTVFRLTIVPEFQAVTLTNGTLNLTFSTEAGGMYQLQYNSDLTSTNWTNLGGPATATGTTLIATDSVETTNAQRFYRLVLAP